METSRMNKKRTKQVQHSLDHNSGKQFNSTVSEKMSGTPTSLFGTAGH
jgi:hypothetical protein